MVARKVWRNKATATPATGGAHQQRQRTLLHIWVWHCGALHQRGDAASITDLGGEVHSVRTVGVGSQVAQHPDSGVLRRVVLPGHEQFHQLIHIAHPCAAHNDQAHSNLLQYGYILGSSVFLTTRMYITNSYCSPHLL